MDQAGATAPRAAQDAAADSGAPRHDLVLIGADLPFAPQRDAQLEWYGNDIDRGVAEILAGATSVRFDGSDLMPGEVGAGSFWKEMTAWISGSENLDTALSNIDASWPR